jgi:hypothetical protein
MRPKLKDVRILNKMKKIIKPLREASLLEEYSQKVNDIRQINNAPVLEPGDPNIAISL